tara:strand:+ start:662 stop:1150 length:489 start_codon:yes stop_codon:yes gene_type:complete
MKNNELKDELKFVTNLVQILKKNKLNTIELNRTFGEFDTVSIKVDGGGTGTSVIKQDFSYPNKEIGFMEEPQTVNSQEKQKNIKEGSVVNSPMVGTVYLAPSPEEKNFVEIGQTIKKGDTLLIIEAMKTMNQIPSSFEGKVIDILVQNEDPVEFGTPLVVIE